MRAFRRLFQSKSASIAASAESEENEGKSHTLEVVIAVLLGFAALATAWAAYQASLDDGNSIQSYNRSIALTDKASQAYDEGNQTLVQDQAIFLEYVKAVQAEDDELATYVLTSLMRPELRKGVAWWSDQPGDKYQTPITPDNPDYTIDSFVESAKLDEQAKAEFKKGSDYDNRGDRYTLVTVILAAALFLLGVAGVTRVRKVEIGFSIIGTVFLFGSLIQLARIYWG